jgi:hypothetical protein
MKQKPMPAFLPSSPLSGVWFSGVGAMDTTINFIKIITSLVHFCVDGPNFIHNSVAKNENKNLNILILKDVTQINAFPYTKHYTNSYYLMRKRI